MAALLARLFKPKETAAERAEWLQRATRAASEHAHRSMLSQLRNASRSFEAAETPAFVASWATSSNAINDDLASQLPTMRARSRQLARNNEWAGSYLKQLDDNVLGASGIRLQMRVRKPGTDQLDSEANAAIESAWQDFGQRGACEVSGKHTWRDIESLAVGSFPRTGELLFRLRPGAGPYRFQIQLLDPALLDDTLHIRHGGNRVRMGVEINDDGKPLAYWLKMRKAGESTPDVFAVGNHVRIPAEQIRHFFLADEIDQLRGVPWLAVGARRLYMAHQFEEAAAVASTNAAQRLGFFVSPDGEAPAGFADTIVSSVLATAQAQGKVLTPDEISAITAAAEKYSTTVAGQFDTLPQGYDFRQYDSPWPNVDAGQYVKDQIRAWTSALGTSYVTVGNDLEAVNYSSAQVGIVGEREHYKTLQARLVSWLHAEVFAAWLPYAILRQPSLSPRRLAEYLAAATWRPRRWQAIDPAKKAKENESDLTLGLTSRSRIILERGDDPEDIAAERASDEALFGPLPSAPAASADTQDPPPELSALQAAGKHSPGPGNFLPSLARPPRRK